MRIILETERLYLRHFEPDDVENLYELNRDPEVRRHLMLPEPPSREEIAEKMIPRFLSWHKTDDKLGFFADVEKATGAFIGWHHFRPSKEDPEDVELGYRLVKDAWGKGYATEAAKALVRRGFVEMRLPLVSATALAGNRASIRVMEKAGLRFAEAFFYRGEDAVRYELHLDEYNAQVEAMNAHP